MKGYELLNFMLGDSELRDIVLLSSAFNRDYTIRRPQKRCVEDLILHHFWISPEGANFRLALERKLGGSIAIRVLRGREARIKDAMLLFICELRRNQHERTRH